MYGSRPSDLDGRRCGRLVPPAPLWLLLRPVAPGFQVVRDLRNPSPRRCSRSPYTSGAVPQRSSASPASCRKWMATSCWTLFGLKSRRRSRSDGPPQHPGRHHDSPYERARRRRSPTLALGHTRNRADAARGRRRGCAWPSGGCHPDQRGLGGHVRSHRSRRRSTGRGSQRSEPRTRGDSSAAGQRACSVATHRSATMTGGSPVSSIALSLEGRIRIWTTSTASNIRL
jgi:hypothetical protein